MVAASSIERGLKMTSEGVSNSAGGQFGSGTLGGSGMVSNLVLNSTEIKPPFSLLVQNKSLSEAVAKQFRTAYDDFREKIAVQTAQDGIPRRVARVDELMALSHRRTIAMMFYRNARDLSKLQLWEGGSPRFNVTLILMLTSCSVTCNHYCGGVPSVLFPIT